MSRIQPINTETETGKTQELLTAVNSQLGGVPNIFSTMAHSPTVLEAYLNFNNTLSQGNLSKQLIEQIALTVAGVNQCDYCASAHTALGKGTGISDEELHKNLKGNSDESKTQAALTFCRAVIESRGGVEDAALDVLRSAGYSNGDIFEIIAQITLNTFTNYFNRIAQTEIDFPAVSTTNLV